MNRTTVESIIKWNLETTSEEGNPRFLFRGVSDCEYKLIPKIARNNTGGVSSEEMQKRMNLMKDYLRTHLPSYGLNLLPLSNLALKECYEIFVAQHHGVPTNLLDFSRNPLVALYFSAIENPKKDGMVYAIRIEEQDYSKCPIDDSNKDYNIVSYDYLTDKLLRDSDGKPKGLETLDRTIFVAPPFVDDRIKAQIGIFCVFPVEKLKEPLNTHLTRGGAGNYEGAQAHIVSFKIRKEDKQKIVEDLNKIGINSISLFPDLRGFGQFVTWKLIRE